MAFKDCSNQGRPVFYAIDDASKRVHVHYARCKLWKCPECAPLLTYIWSLRIWLGVETYQEDGLSAWNMATITSHEKLKSTASCLAVWPRVWAKLSTRLRRVNSCSLKYALLPEHHQDGRVHFHALTSASIDTRWLKDNARECGAGYQAEVKPLKASKHAAYYVTKYVGKDMLGAVWPKGFRRVRTSRGWPCLPLAHEGEYNGLIWRKWRENGEKGYFGLMSSLPRLHPGYSLVAPDMRPHRKGK